MRIGSWLAWLAGLALLAGAPSRSVDAATAPSPPALSAAAAAQERLDSALLAAASAGDVKAVTSLLAKRAAVDALDEHRSTPLMRAAGGNHLEAVELLIDHGANPNAADDKGFTPLMVAAYAGSAEIVQFLLDKGADANARDRDDHTALMAAAHSGSADRVKLLLDHGADLRAVDKDGFSALMVAAGSGAEDTVRLLLDRGAHPTGRTRSGFTALMQAAGAGNAGIVKLLLDRGANVNASSDGGSSALMVASYAGRAEVVKTLLDRGADPRVTDHRGHTALMGGAYSGSDTIVKDLLDRGVEVNLRDASDHTALMQAAYAGNPRSVKLLLDHGSEVDARDRGGFSALMQAAGSGHAEAARLLLEHGADVEAVDARGNTAMTWATRRGHADVIALLKTAEEPPSIDGQSEAASPLIVGASPGYPFIYRIPAGGNRVRHFSAVGLPRGLRMDPVEGIVTGVIEQPGSYHCRLTVISPAGKTVRSLTIICHSHSLALTPPMGWDSWNAMGDQVTAEKVREQADWLIKRGLAAHGYQYMIVDDTWEGRRDSTGALDSSARFGDIRNLAKYLHDRGLKLGLYSAATPMTCSGYAGSGGHEDADAALFASWGVDYLKYDWCQSDINLKKTSDQELKTAFQAMRQALNKTSRDIVYAINPYGLGDVTGWGNDVGANSWATSAQIFDKWDLVESDGTSQGDHARVAGPGHWNDPGWLMVGKLGAVDAHFTRLKPPEQTAQFTLWSMLAAPLILSCDLRQLDPSSLYPVTTRLLTNDEVIAVDQDPLGRAGSRVWRSDSFEAWTRPLSDGTRAVAIFNRQDGPQAGDILWADLGLRGGQPVRDLWQHSDLAPSPTQIHVQLPQHGAVIFKVGTPTPEASSFAETSSQ